MFVHGTFRTCRPHWALHARVELFSRQFRLVAICHAKELWKIGMAASFTNPSAAKRGLSPAPLRPLRANVFLLTPKPLHPTSLLRSEPSKVSNQLM
jgi:hypothetical protein